MKTNNNLITYVKTSSSEAQKNQKYFVYKNINVVIKDDFIIDINLKDVLKKLFKAIPNSLFHQVEAIYVGQFKELNQRKINAAYMDGAIYITNTQSSEDDLIDDLVHELAHSIEEMIKFDIYEDGKIISEFTSKRLKLKEILLSNNYKTDKQDFENIEFSEKFDKYLYEDIGYPILHTLVVGLFCSPYGATSIREYFANGFEYFYLKDRQYVKTISPQLYKKLIDLEKGIYFNNEQYYGDNSY